MVYENGEECKVYIDDFVCYVFFFIFKLFILFEIIFRNKWILKKMFNDV